MARITYPVTFEAQQTLLTAILAQNKKLGAKSPVVLFAKQHKTDLAKLEASIGLAAEQNTASSSLRKDSENDTQQRNALLELPWAHQLGEVQFLKHFFAGAERELGKWGITVDAQARIVYPTDVVLQAELVQTFLKYHLSLGDESPLQLYLDEHTDIDVEADLSAAGEVIAMNTERNVTTGNSELATQQRDKIWEPSVTAMHLIGAFLMGLYHEDSRKMAVWGFVVVEDAAGEREQHSKVNPLEAKVQKSIVIPSVFTNVGEYDLQVWKGAKKEGEPVVVKPGDVLGMTKGYSAITIYNPSSLIVGEYTVTIHV